MNESSLFRFKMAKLDKNVLVCIPGYFCRSFTISIVKQLANMNV